MKKTIKTIFSLSVFALVLFLIPSKSFAADMCEVEKRMFDKNLLSDVLGIPLTTKDFVTSVATSAYSTTTGYGLTETVNCGTYISSKVNLPSNDATDNFYSCSGTSDDVCAQIIGDNATVASSNNWLVRHSQSRASGTLLGAAYLTGEFTTREPLPANLAVYFNDTMSRIPVVNKTFAAPVDYGHSLINAILDTWKVFRNLAYALMAIIMLYTGIIIILRRKINSQLVVSVQYALPRIVIAIVLITFSYPIGATLGSLGWTLFKSNWALAGTLFTDVFNTVDGSSADPTSVSTALRIWTLMIPFLVLAGTGPIFLLAILVIIIIFLIAGIIFNFKAIVIYMKIIFSILTAPLEFALGAVPGNDDKLKAWFLRMGKYVLTLFAMGIILPLGTIIAYSVATAYATETGGAGALFGSALPVFIVLYCFGLGIGMEKRIDEFMGGGQKKR